MSKSNLRIAILVLGLATALIHLYLNVRMGRFDPAFTANGIGYLVLLAVFFKWVNLPFLQGREKIVWYVYMGYTALTIVAYFAVNSNPFGDVLGLVDKAVEVLLIAALWLHKDNS